MVALILRCVYSAVFMWKILDIQPKKLLFKMKRFKVLLLL